MTRSIPTIFFALMLATGCVARPDMRLVDHVYRGEHGLARQYLKDKLGKDGAVDPKATPKHPDRNFILNRMRLGITTLADGYAPRVHSTWDEVYQLLRRSAINKDKQAAAVVLNEDLKIWKGEPFEQALAFHYVGAHYGMQRSWDNTRTAYLNSLFPLQAILKGRHSTLEVLEASRGKDEHFFDHPREEKTDFTLGYLMAGIAAQQVGLATGDPERQDEAKRQISEALSLRPRLSELARGLDPRLYNTILVVEYGQGPEKIGTGMDNAVASFQPVTSSSESQLVMEADGRAKLYPWVCDVNAMAADHMWNSLQDMRLAKSYIGTGLMAAGAATSLIGAHNNSEIAVIAGVATMAAGAFAKAGAHADTRYCELIPQRIYVAPLKVSAPNATVTLHVENAPQSRMVLTGLNPPSGPTAQLLYVRLISAAPAPPAWAVSAQTVYCNDHDPTAGKVHLPYILGGDCVCTPSRQSLESYQRAGFLKDFSVTDLEQLYRQEGIRWTIQDEGGVPGLHVLEGGRSLLAPEPGSAGYARLFGVKHPSYRARSKHVKELYAQIQEQLARAQSTQVSR